MKLAILICFCILATTRATMNSKSSPVVMDASLPANTLSQDLDEIARMIPFGALRQMATRYLLNDEQFQAFVRLINSNDAYTIQMHLRSQPDVITFSNWVRQQIMLSGEEFALDESEEHLSILNRSPYWSNTVNGWPGVVNEFFFYYPENMIHNHIQLKMAQNGIFAQLIQRLQDLKPVYDGIIALPAAQRLAGALEAKGINTTALDAFIRNQFGWQQTRAAAGVQDFTALYAYVSQTTDVPASPEASDV